MKNPKVGEIVMIYDSSHGNVLGRVGKIIEIKKGPWVTVLINGRDPVEDCVHRCQCLRIKPKKVRRTIWAKFNGEGTFILDAMNKRPKTCWHNDLSSCDDSCYDPDWFEFREVRK